jgi:WD40 repeat protein
MKPADIIIQDAHSGGNVVRFNHAGTLLASGGWEGRVNLWHLPDGKTGASWKAHEGSVNGLAFMKNDMKRMAVAAALTRLNRLTPCRFRRQNDHVPLYSCRSAIVTE